MAPEKLRDAGDDEPRPGRCRGWPTVPDTQKVELRDWTVRRCKAIADRAAELAGIVAADRPAWAARAG